MITHSDIPKQNKYVGQIKNYDPTDPALNTAHIEGWIDELHDRYMQLAEMRRDIVEFAELYGKIHRINFMYAKDEKSWYLGPKAATTRLKTNWVLDIALSNPAVRKRISQTIEDMKIHGRRIPRKKGNAA